jgi:hypothetical protein
MGVQALPAGLAQLRSRESANCLAVAGLRAPLQRANSTWADAARALDPSFATRALAAFGHIRLVLPADRDTAVFDIAPGARWRLLRRARPLAAHA